MIVLNRRDFLSQINTGEKFRTNERDNELMNLIEDWNRYVSGNKSNKRLEIDWIELKDPLVDFTINNIDLGEIRLTSRTQALYLYLNNSKIKNIALRDPQNALKEKVIQWDGKSRIEKLEVENIHLTSDDRDSLIIANIEIGNFYIVRTINLSEKVQILGCTIEKLILSASDLWRMIFIQNELKNVYVTASVFFKTVLLSNTIWIVHQRIQNIERFSEKNFKIPNSVMADISRQFKNAFDESKDYPNWDRFYADEMLYTLKSKFFLSPLLFLHLISSRFGTSWIRAISFLMTIWFIKLCFTNWITWNSAWQIAVSTINNINPYTNLKEVNIMSVPHFIYLIFLSYWIYQFVLSVRRLSKR